MKAAAAVLIFLAMTGCSALESVDRTRLNHGAMDLTKDRTPPQPPYLTNLGSIQTSSGGNSCSVCAH
jgi:hypothetical protein